MKSRLLVAFFAITLLSVTSCKKPVENNGLVGNWKLTVVYDGYLNGGSFKWNVVTSENSHILSFPANGNYTRKDNVNGNPTPCTGTYLLQNSNDLEISSNCNSSIEKGFVSELTASTFIIDRMGIEGKIRYKYTAAK